MNIADVLRALALMARTPEEIDQHGYEGLRISVASVCEDGGLAGREVSLEEFGRELAEQVVRQTREEASAASRADTEYWEWAQERLSGHTLSALQLAQERLRKDMQAQALDEYRELRRVAQLDAEHRRVASGPDGTGTAGGVRSY